MLPEMAWTLKKGEVIEGTNPDTCQTFRGRVYGLLNKGFGVQDYIDTGCSIIQAIKRQHDGPTVVMLMNDGVIIPWKPDYVERVTDDFKVICSICKEEFNIPLPLRAFDLMAQGEHPEIIFENYVRITRAMIEQSRCTLHCDPERLCTLLH